MCVSVCINYILSVFLYYKVQCYLVHKLDYKYIAAYMQKSVHVSAKTKQYRKGLNTRTACQICCLFSMLILDIHNICVERGEGK